MKGSKKSGLNAVAMLMGIIILFADLYWIATSYFVALWFALGVIILVADLVWLFVDYKLSK
jgi:hypothetical protein